jgi:hypothetical protein
MGRDIAESAAQRTRPYQQRERAVWCGCSWRGGGGSPKGIDVSLLSVVVDISSLQDVRGTGYFLHELRGKVVELCAGSNDTEPGTSVWEAEAVTDTRDACVSDHNFVFVQEDIAGVQALVNDATSMQIAHASGNLLGSVDTLLQREGL